jgi:methylase of polypeptide subunit release factors
MKSQQQSKAAYHLIAQAREIAAMKRRKRPYRVYIAGQTITVLPRVYPGGTDSELICHAMRIREGDNVLDLCTGTGIIGIVAAKRGASSVTCVDINPHAIATVRLNQHRMQLHTLTAVRGNLFRPVKGKRFDVIIYNPPYTKKAPRDTTEACFWDRGNNTTIRFFRTVRRFRKRTSRVYIGWADFASIAWLRKTAKRFRFRLQLLKQKGRSSGKATFYVLQVT